MGQLIPISFFPFVVWRKCHTFLGNCLLSMFANKKISRRRLISITRDPAGARTQDPNIKSVVLYLLSYRVIAAFCGCKSTAFFFIIGFFGRFFFINPTYPSLVGV